MRHHGKKCAVLAYHEVMPESNYAYCVTSQAFAEQLCRIQSLANDDFIESYARVTFDDGERSQYHHAGPLLSRHSISATYFVTPGLIGSAAKFLGWSELKALQSAGHSIQSHGWSHKFLPQCSDDELAHELSASKQVLEDRLGAPVFEISMPGGRWDSRVIDACAQAGYKHVHLSDPWVEAEMSGVELIGRFMVRRSTSLGELQKMVLRDRQALWKLRMRSQLRQGIVGLVGDGLYHRLWCRLTGYNEFEAARQETRS